MKTIKDLLKEHRKKAILLAAALILITGFMSSYDAYRQDPNLLNRWNRKILKEDQPVTISYEYDSEHFFGRHKIPIIIFKPDRKYNYTFTITDIVSDEDVYLYMNVTDKHFNSYANTDNFEDFAEGDVMSETVFLNSGSKCYVLIEAITQSDLTKYSGSFTITVSKESKEQEEEPTEPELKLNVPVSLTVGSEERSAALFRPEETGFYRFKSRIVTKDDTAGSSDIALITSADNKEISQAEGICYLEGGNEYYVWVSAEDISGRSARVKVSCSMVDTLEADDTGTYSISGSTIIKFKAKESENLAVYSESDGNPHSSVYDDKGFPVGSDKNSGGAFSGNDKDFALVIPAQKNRKYLIYIGGKFTECNITIARYTGDGSSLGPDDIEPAKAE